MGVFKGLDAINKAVEERGGGDKAKWFRLKAGQQATVRIVSEFSADSPHYDESRGVVLVASEHVSPVDYKRRALCTNEDRCFRCEQARAKPKTGWGSKLKAYMTVLVTVPGEGPYMAIWSMGVSKDVRWAFLKEHFDENGSISNVEWKVKRTGSTKDDTNYIMKVSQPDVVPFDWSKYEPIDLETKAVRNVPYADQQNFYFGIVQAEKDAEPDTGSTNEW